jgi:DNA repair exonuclease SbcCD ATPase subunit
MSVEREVYLVTGQLQYTQTPDDLLHQAQQLTDRIVKLIEQLQDTEHLLKTYRDPSAPQSHIVYQRRQLLQTRVDEALTIHSTIPTHLMGLKDVQEAREIERLTERIQRLTLQLEDIEKSYTEIDHYRAEPSLEAARLRNLDEE